MTLVVVLLLACLGLAGAVVAMVAVPARREGREVLSPEGEEVVAGLRDRTEAVVGAARSSRDRLARPPRTDRR